MEGFCGLDVHKDGVFMYILKALEEKIEGIFGTSTAELGRLTNLPECQTTQYGFVGCIRNVWVGTGTDRFYSCLAGLLKQLCVMSSPEFGRFDFLA